MKSELVLNPVSVEVGLAQSVTFVFASNGNKDEERMVTLAWIVIGLVVAGAAVAGLLSLISHISKATLSGVISLLLTIFGRNPSKLAKLVEPSELTQELPSNPRDDWCVKQISEWRPNWFEQWPVWRSIWLEERVAVSDTATHSDIESLFRESGETWPPYKLLDHPPIFDSGGRSQRKRPEEPEYLLEEYPAPTLILPLWNSPLQFLNGYVKAAHAELIGKFRQLDARRAALRTAAQQINRARKEEWRKACERYDAHVERRETARISYEKKRDSDLVPLRDARSLIEKGSPEGTIKHFDLVLRRLNLPDFVPREWAIDFDAATKTLLVEYRFPDIARLSIKKNRYESKSVSQKFRRDILQRIQPALCVRLARAIADADSFNLLRAVAINGWVDFFDRATGQPRRAYCASLIAQKEVLLCLNLTTADPIAAFESLRGSSAGETYETTPIMPSLRLQKDDPRFVAPRQTIERMKKGENLAAMNWEEFEHLVRELFEREFAANGAEVKITRASKDRGVDAVIFDPDPLRGGKIVVQAKRYTSPVDVSAVRDLYGTVLNEGANTGILVTTSHYGPDAYQFAQNKNIKLINGAQLLGLLEKAGYRFRIDLAEARALIAKR